MHIDKFKQEDGRYVSESGCHYDTAEDFLTMEYLSFCGCGMPDEAGKFVLKVLRALNTRSENNRSDKDTWKEDSERIWNLFPDKGAAYFILYMLDEVLKLEEHGGSTPGWLTEHGKRVLEDLEELYKD